MIIYFRPMRHKDEYKQDAIIRATVKLVNKIGFVSSSVSKIAKEANVSPATIYIYYKNKEDLLVSTYLAIKDKMGKAVLKDFDPELPIRDIFRNVWFNMFDFIENNLDLFEFTEQFANSPFTELVKKDEIEQSFEPLIRIMNIGIEQKIIKDVPFDVLTAFAFYPIFTLSNARICNTFEKTSRNIETAFDLSWDAIKL